MATEQKSTAVPAETVTVPAIENEIPSYRAISPEAVFSLLFGVLAILSFAHWLFLVCAVLAVIVGIIADRKIQRLNDILTGRGIAQAGITLGLIFGLSALTVITVQDWILVREASKFARAYESVLNKGSFEEALWYGESPRYRANKSPQELYNEIKKSKGRAGMFDLDNASLIRLRERLNEGGAEIRFSKIEQHGKEGLDAVAAALFELHSEGKIPLPEGERYAIALLKGWNKNRGYDWWVERVGFPYKPDSYKPAPKPVDDGHGHAG